MVTTWLKLLPIEFQFITDFAEPGADSTKYDHQVGVMNDELKRFYTYWQSCAKSAEQMMLDARYSNPSEEDIAKIRELQAKVEVLHDIFWIAIKDEFGLWIKSSVGVRRGFVVVWCDLPERQSGFTFRFG